MPNDCMNKLIVLGPTQDVEFFVDKSKEKFSFAAYLPMPEPLQPTTFPTGEFGQTEEAAQLRELYGTDNWYDWRLANWGTKWDAYGDPAWDNLLEYDEGRSTNEVFFDTAWSPPIEFVERISEQYPTIKFILKYAEPGNDFAGHVEVKQGDVEVIAEGEYFCKDTIYILDTLDLWDDVEEHFYNWALDILKDEEPVPEELQEEFKQWCLERLLAHSHPPQAPKENFKDLVQQAVDTYANHT